jgi:hypothetical protein
MNIPEGKANDLGQAIDGFTAPDLSPAEYADHYAKSVANGLEATQLCEVVEIKAAVGQMHFMCRVKKECERDFVHGPIKTMLFRLENICEVFFGKEFFLKDDHMVYAWVLSFGADDLEPVLRAISEALAEIGPKLVVTEAPLLGPGTPTGSLGRGAGASGSKGAQPIRG